jgi:hypothetical protein
LIPVHVPTERSSGQHLFSMILFQFWKYLGSM